MERLYFIYFLLMRSRFKDIKVHQDVVAAVHVDVLCDFKHVNYPAKVALKYKMAINIHMLLHNPCGNRLNMYIHVYIHVQVALLFVQVLQVLFSTELGTVGSCQRAYERSL